MSFVRIVILNYNSASKTSALANSLLSQVYASFEIVVVDNASADTDKEALIKCLSPTIHLVESAFNCGYSGGNNLGLKFNSGHTINYHLILNPDIYIQDDFFIQKMVDGFQYKGYLPIFAQSPLVNTIPSEIPISFQIQVRKLLSAYKLYLLSFSFSKFFFYSFYQEYIYASHMPFNNQYLSCDTINGAAFMVKDEFVRANNYLDSNVFLYHEELILGKQIQNWGGQCLLNGYVTVDHLQGFSTKSNKHQFNREMEKLKYLSEAYFFKEYLHINSFFIYFFKFFKRTELFFKHKIYRFK